MTGGARPKPDIGSLEVRAATPADAEGWLRLRDELWPGDFEDHATEIEVFFQDPPARQACFVAWVGDEMVGFAEVGLREYAEGCATSPVGYLEGIYVDPAWRRDGVGRLLNEAGEAWARSKGCTEMASDRALANEPSGRFHERIGYVETERVVCYRKALAGERS